MVSRLGHYDLFKPRSEYDMGVYLSSNMQIFGGQRQNMLSAGIG
jgi:hypothetical protein